MFFTQKRTNAERIRREHPWIWSITRSWPKKRKIRVIRLGSWQLLTSIAPYQTFFVLVETPEGQDIIEVLPQEGVSAAKAVVGALSSDKHLIVGLASWNRIGGDEIVVILPAKGTTLDAQCRRAVCPTPEDLQDLEYMIKLELELD